MLELTPELQSRLLAEVAREVIAHADELCELDRAIGDGDHGVNLRRGFEAVLAEEAAIAKQPLASALEAIGLQLVMNVGGASGPLYGTLFIALGRALARPDVGGCFERAFGEAVGAVGARGKSKAGQKSLLDVLVPLHAALAAFHAPAAPRYEHLAAIAQQAAEATIPMRALSGRAAFLGERSIGHMDPGARSASLMTGAVCNVLSKEGRQPC